MGDILSPFDWPMFTQDELDDILMSQSRIDDVDDMEKVLEEYWENVDCDWLEEELAKALKESIEEEYSNVVTTEETPAEAYDRAMKGI